MQTAASWAPRGFGRASNGRSTEDRLEQRERRTSTSRKAATGLASTAATVAAMAPPWSLIGAGVLAAVAGGLAISNKLRTQGSMALAGDQRAIAAFLRRSARWGAKKRQRKAVALAHHLQKVRARIRARGGPRKASNRLVVAEAKTRLKLGALVALELQARKAPAEPLVADDAATIPEQADTSPEANADAPDDDVETGGWLSMDNKVGPVPVPVLLGGGLVLGFAFIAWAASRGGSADRSRRAA